MSRALRWVALALAAIQPLAQAAEPGAGILDAKALEALKECVKARPLSFCVAPDRALPACKADFCKAATSPGVISPEKARVQLKNIAPVIALVATETALFKQAASALQADAENSAALLAQAKKIEANPWDVTRADHPAGDRATAELQRCRELPESACFAEAANLLALRASSLAFRALVQRVNWEDLEKSVACTELLRKRYESYFDASRFQWPWELYLNGLPFARGETPLMCEGFRDVPTRQWIVMHPALALRYSENAAQKIDAVLLLEVFGIRRWEWAGPQAVNARGGSVILTYGKQSDARSVGWGALVHFKDDVSFGLVRHKPEPGSNNKVSLILGYDFGTLVGQDKAAACKKLFDPELCERVAR